MRTAPTDAPDDWAPPLFLQPTPIFVAEALAAECDAPSETVLTCLESHSDARVRRNVRFERRLAGLRITDPVAAQALLRRMNERGIDMLARLRRRRHGPASETR